MADHRERFTLLDRAICDRELSDEARLLYCYLNQRSGKDGQTRRKRQTIADDLGWSSRKVTRAIGELEDHRYCVSKQQQHSQEYTLAWAQDGQICPTSVAGEDRQICLGRMDKSVQPDAPVSLYDPSLLTKPSTIEDGRSVEASSTSAPDRPTDPPDPAHEEPATPEDQLLIGLANRELPTDCRMAAQVIVILRVVPVEFFLAVLDRKLRRKYRLRQEFDIAWLPTVARDAVDVWRHQARIAPQRARVGLESVAIA